MKKQVRFTFVAAALACAVLVFQSAPTQSQSRGRGSATTDNRMPPSVILSPESRNILDAQEGARGGGGRGRGQQPTDVVAQRRAIDDGLQDAIKHMVDLYPVDIQETMMGGISVAVVTPKGGVPARNKDRVLLNMPGGGFVTAVRGNGLRISIPVASLGGFKVITGLYRQGPEYRFPAANEDLTAIYKEVLKTYKAANIGMFGCSAGASLIAEEIPYLQSKGLPKPAVLGLYCGGAYDFIGDSAGISALINGNSPSAGGAGYAGMDYFKGIDVKKPEVIPATSDELIKQFPPTIFVTATRDMAMSNAAYSYRRMIKAGIDAQLLIYDGLGHGFMTNPDFPETRDLTEIAVKFYDKHLGR